MGDNLSVLSGESYDRLYDFVRRVDNPAMGEVDVEFAEDLVEKVYLGFFGRLSYMISCCCCGSQADTAKLVANVVRPFLEQLKTISKNLGGRMVSTGSSSPSDVRTTRVAASVLVRRAPDSQTMPSTQTASVPVAQPAPVAASSAAQTAPVVRSARPKRRQQPRPAAPVTAPAVPAPAPRQEIIDFTTRPVIAFGTTKYTVTSEEELINAMRSFYRVGMTQAACQTITVAGKQAYIQEHDVLRRAFQEAVRRNEAAHHQVGTSGSQVANLSLANQAAAAARARRTAS